MPSLLDLLTGRIPPHSLEAERAVLGCFLVEPGACAAARPRLPTETFYKEGHRTIYRTMGELLDMGRALDLVTVLDALHDRGTLEATGGAIALATLVDEAAIPTSLETYLALIGDKAHLRSLITLGTRIVTRAYENHRPPIDLVTEAEHELEELGHLAAPTATVFPALTVGELLRTEVPAVPFLVQGWIPARALSFIVGDSEAYKSWFALALALSIAAGIPFLGTFPVVQAPTLVISEENGLAEDQRRVRLLCRGLDLDADAVPCHIASEASFSFDDPVRYAALRAYVEEHAIQFVTVDSFVRVHRRKENDAGEMNALYLDRMKPLLQEGTALNFLHHRRKAQVGPGQAQQQTSDSDEIRGSGDIRAATHSVLFLRTVSETQVLVRHNKTRGFRRQEPFVFAVQDTGQGGVVIRWEGKPQDALDKSGAAKEAILLYASTRGTFARKDLEAELKGKISKKVLRPILDELSRTGTPLRHELRGPRHGHWYVYVPQGPDDSPGEGPEDAQSDLGLPF